MSEVTMIGVDLAKSVFQAHGATAAGEPVFRKKLSRGQFLKFLSVQPSCVVAMEACASSHYCCLLYTSPSPRDRQKSRMPSSA